MDVRAAFVLFEEAFWVRPLHEMTGAPSKRDHVRHFGSFDPLQKTENGLLEAGSLQGAWVANECPRLRNRRSTASGGSFTCMDYAEAYVTRSYLNFDYWVPEGTVKISHHKLW